MLQCSSTLLMLKVYVLIIGKTIVELSNLKNLPPMSKSGKAASRSPLATCGGSRSEAEGDCATNAFPLVILQSINARTRTLPQSLRDSVSLRLGHATALTPHRGVIHYRGAASLPQGEA